MQGNAGAETRLYGSRTPLLAESIPVHREPNPALESGVKPRAYYLVCGFFFAEYVGAGLLWAIYL